MMGLDINNGKRPMRQVRIDEWNTEVKAFVKDLSVMEQLVVKDTLDDYFNPRKSASERAEAALAACVMVLVNEEGEQLLDNSQIPSLKNASFNPVVRTIAHIIDSSYEEKSLKKI